ncbi:MAG: FAD-dependent oxidoreductase [Alphaproteobacteria bacterium]|nr:FAD-dependent oxidoreductase [Alphaproteobacteria bacterium]
MTRRPTDGTNTPYGSEIFKVQQARARRRREARGTIVEPAREIPVFDEVDVLVAGGGPAGTAAAIAAARLGARTLLVERHNHLGGLATGGLVIWIDRMTDWDGKPVIRGVAEEILARLPEEAIHGPAPADWGSRQNDVVAHWGRRFSAFRGIVTWAPMTDPEWMKQVSSTLVREAGAELLLHAWIARPLMEGPRATGAILESKQGRLAIRAKRVVDTTGDGDLFVQAGAAHDADIDEDSIHHCMNVAWLWGGVDMARWFHFAASDPAGHKALLAEGRARLGLFEPPMASWRNDVCVFMGPRYSGFSAVDLDDLNAVETLSRDKLYELLAYFRRHAPGFEKAWVMLTAPQMGVRHSRRARGLAGVSASEWKRGHVHDDEIGISPSLTPNFPSVSVPYRALLPAGVENLLVAGRHVACDASSHGFMREIPQCWMTGQAAGTAAALSIADGRMPTALDTASLQAALRRQGVHLHDAHAGRNRAAE